MLDYKNPELTLSTKSITTQSVIWRSPSNIAIVKYWGKYGIQLPRNPSLSFTLQNAYTETKVTFQTKETSSDEISLDFYFEEKENEAFKKKLVKFLSSITDIFPFLPQLDLTIHSHNSFPHSAGIASSASSMSALALCLCDIENILFGTLTDQTEFLKKASFVARLGSGSASRSVYPIAAVWGEHKNVKESSNLYAVEHIGKINNVFHSYHDDILIVSKKEKSVSSRAGHALMEGNAYAAPRYQQANDRLSELLVDLEKGDLEHFGQILEEEALTLHALMMTSTPPYLLMKPNSLMIIEKIWAFRKDTKLPLYFTLDAGPNLHLLYPDNISKEVKSFIQSDLVPHCEDDMWLQDIVGQGGVKM